MAGSNGKGKSGSTSSGVPLRQQFPQGEALILNALRPRPPVSTTPEGEAALRRYLSRPASGRLDFG